MRFCVLDIETDGFLDTVSKIHCLSYQIFEGKNLILRGSITDYEQMVTFIQRQEYIFCHNVIGYDKIVFEKILGIQEFNAKFIDSLALSYYLYPYRPLHGLESWGEDIGVKKPEVQDWKNLSIEEYIHRCEEDVEINTQIVFMFLDYLYNIYQNTDAIINLCMYLSFKMECLADQESIGIHLNVELAEKHLKNFTEIFEEKTRLLIDKMPVELGKVIKTRPKKMFKKDGDISKKGLEWIEYLSANNLPETTEIVREECNPGSTPQLKNWLFKLGWNPITFKVSKNTGKKVPQISLPFGAGLCPSVKDLYEVEPALEELDGYFRLRHRIGILKGFLKAEKDGKVYATAHGFTNTLRLTHSNPVVNLPKPEVLYGKEIREVLYIPDENYIMCGSDVSGLEDNTKQHYIYFHDPEYVEQMRVPGFDPHIDIGVLAGLMSKEEEEFYKWAVTQENLSPEDSLKLSSIKKKRGVAKSANFCATYGGGGPKIAETAKIPLEDGINLHTIYWKRNAAIKKIASQCIVKTVQHEDFIKVKKKTGEIGPDGKELFITKTVKVLKSQKWLFNPLSGYWLFLKAEKDRFSTLNQNTGVFVFDSWLYKVRKKLKPYGIKICLQYHDEIMLYFDKKYKNIVNQILKESMEEVNDSLNLNVKIDISIDYGKNYAECH